MIDSLKSTFEAKKLKENCRSCDHQGVKCALNEDRNTAEKVNEFVASAFAAKGIGEKHT